MPTESQVATTTIGKLEIKNGRTFEDNSENEENETSGASATEAVINICKICIGAGILTLPYTFQCAGMIPSAMAVLFVAGWNYYTCHLLLACKAAVNPEDLNKYSSLSTFSSIVGAALGRFGLVLADFTLALLFLGACSIYVVAISGLLAPVLLTPSYQDGNEVQGEGELSGLNTSRNCILALMLIPFCLPRNLAVLARASAASLFALLMGLGCIVMYGIQTNQHHQLSEEYSLARKEAVDSVLWTPTEGVVGMSTLFGVLAFSYGIQLMLFPIQESMARPQEMKSCLALGLGFTGTLYVVVGMGIGLLFTATLAVPGDGFKMMPQNVLLVFPPKTILARLVGVLVAGCVFLSYPLAMNPLNDMTERLIMSWVMRQTERSEYKHIGHSAVTPGVEFSTDNSQRAPQSNTRPPQMGTFNHVIVVTTLVAASAALASMVPYLGLMVSLFGSYSLTFLGFVLPPLCHLRICQLQLSQFEKACDVAAVVLGTVACIFSTFIALSAIISKFL